MVVQQQHQQEDNPQAGQGRPLPKKEQDLFKSVVRQYETKQYKKGMKAADAILKKFPKHGETLCMKGLITNYTGTKEEAITLVKMGLMNDMRSHVCWHVYGLIHRAHRNYNEAIKAYKQALRIDHDNLQILRDLSLLQIQMRDISGFVTTRRNILQLKSNQVINWTSFALAKHLAGDLEGAISVIDIYLSTLDEKHPDLNAGFESSELALYKNMILSEIGDYSKALDHLMECKRVVVDEFSWMKIKGGYELQLQRFDDAKETFLQLLERGSTEDYSIHSSYMCAVLKMDPDICKEAIQLKGAKTLATHWVLTREQMDILLQEYQTNLLSKFPKSAAVQRIPFWLMDSNSPEWLNAMDQYIRSNIEKGVPSLGSDLSSLLLIENKQSGKYEKASDVFYIKSHPIYTKIVSLVDSYISSLEQNSRFPKDDENEQPPSTLLWTWYLRAYLHEMAGEYLDGLSMIDKCLHQTPTAVDMYELKGLLLQNAGDWNAGADCLNEGRELDKQDRYINNLTTKYLLQANREDEALEKIAMFTRHESPPEKNIFDMQCTWYELELAACLARKKEWGKSLKKYMAVEQHFEDFHEDQFDFHSYCIRKVTLRAYIDVLRWEDVLWGHDVYATAAEGIINIYLYLYDHPKKEDENEEPDFSSMTAAERKKAKAQLRKKKLKSEKSKNVGNNEDSSTADKGGSQQNGKVKGAVDTDPLGEELVQRDSLEEAKKYVSTLVKNAPNRFATWILQYDVSIRRGKIIMALQALFRAKALEPNNPELFTRIVDLSKRKPSLPVSESSIVQSVIDSELSNLLENKSLSEFIANEAKRVKEDNTIGLGTRIAVSRALITCNAGSIADACSLIVDKGLDVPDTSLEKCKDAAAWLKEIGSDSKDAYQRWVTLAKSRYIFMDIQ
jgi:peptide alpha-N-acetyltransferase